MNMEKEVLTLNIEDVLPNRFQPRIKFKEENINELAESIKEHGVIQPIVVRKISDKYEIIAGERRYKASILAGKTTIPAIVTNLDDKNSAEIALIENVQRQDLTPIEEAISYKKILDMGYINQTDLAVKLGKTQSTIANKLRLLNLDESVQEALLNEKISERHARSLLKLDKKTQSQMLERIINERMTVRKTDEEISKLLSGETGPEKVIETTPVVEEPSVVQEKQTEKPDVEVLDFDLNEEKLENTIELPKLEEIKTGVENIMDENQFNIPSTPIFESTPQQIEMEKQESENQTTTVEMAAPQQSIEQVPQEIPTMPVIDTMLPEENVEAQQASEQEIPVENIGMAEITPSSVQTPPTRKFFNMFDLNNQTENFVEDIENKQVNMNIEEEELQNPFDLNNSPTSETMINEPFEQKLEPYSLDDNQKFTNINEINSIEPMESDIPDVQIPQAIDQSKPSIQPQVQPIVQQEISTSNAIPVQQPEQPKAPVNNLRLVINTIRECANTIEKYGFDIDTEEVDFEDMYEVTFKINKKN